MIVLLYILAIVVANLTVAAMGPWFSPINGFLLIGLDLALRDKLHDRWQGKAFWPRMLALIATAGAASYVLNPASGSIALASFVAFSAAATVDALVYQWLHDKPWFVKSNASNTVAAGVDSLLFPLIAFGGLSLPIVAMQFLAKTSGGAIWAWIVGRFK